MLRRPGARAPGAQLAHERRSVAPPPRSAPRRCSRARSRSAPPSGPAHRAGRARAARDSARRCPRRRPTRWRGRRRAARPGSHRPRTPAKQTFRFPGSRRDAMAVAAQVGQLARQLRPELVAQAREALRLGRQLRQAELDGLREAHDERHRQGARAPAELVAASVQQRLERDARAAAAARRARPRPSGRRACAHRTRAGRRRARATSSGQLADRLRGVAVQQHAALAADARRSPRAAGARRSRCWPPSPRPAACGR